MRNEQKLLTSDLPERITAMGAGGVEVDYIREDLVSTRTDTSQQQAERIGNPARYCEHEFVYDEANMEYQCEKCEEYALDVAIELSTRIQELEQQNEFLTNAKDEMVQRACADYELAIAELEQRLLTLTNDYEQVRTDRHRLVGELANAKADGIAEMIYKISGEGHIVDWLDERIGDAIPVNQINFYANQLRNNSEK